MADFEDALNNILADPDAMGQIMALAGKLGGGAPSSPPPDAEPAPEPDSSPLPELEQMGRLLELFQGNRPGRPESVALLKALRPFLRPAQQGKLDRALRLAGLSQTARQVYQLWKEGEIHV